MKGFDIDTLRELYDDPPLSDLVDAAATEVVKRSNKRLEYELRGAWRAGYDYVHVYEETGTALGVTDTIRFSNRRWVYPSDTRGHPNPPGLEYQYTYDLTSVPDDVIRQAIRGDDE